MVTCSKTGMYYARGQWVPADENAPAALAALGFDEAARQNARKAKPLLTCRLITTAATKMP